MAPKNNPRFARVVRDAFSALGVTQAAFHDELRGPSDTTLRKIIDGDPVGISARTLAALDRGFQWTPGSASRTLAGGDPVPLSDEGSAFISRVRHPYNGRVISEALNDPDSDLLKTLEELLETGQLPGNAQAQLQRLRDDAAIKHFPALFEKLDRSSQLELVRYGQRLRYDQVADQNLTRNESGDDSVVEQRLRAVTDQGGMSSNPEDAARAHFDFAWYPPELAEASAKVREIFVALREVDESLDLSAELDAMHRDLEPVANTPHRMEAILRGEIDLLRKFRERAAEFNANKEVEAAISEIEAFANRGAALLNARSSLTPNETGDVGDPVARAFQNLPAAARTAPPGYQPGRSEQGEALDDSNPGGDHRD